MKREKKNKALRKFFAERIKDLETEPHCLNRDPRDSLIIIKFQDGHIHNLLPSSTSTEEILEPLIASENLSFSVDKQSDSGKARPVVLRNRQALGDILMMTAGVRDFKHSFPNWPIAVATTAIHIWDNNPYIDQSLLSNNPEVIDIGPGFLTNASNRDDRHFANAFRISIEDKLGISIKQGPIRPDIWMTEEETSTPIIDPPYWIIVAGEKGDWTAKTYSFKRWQEIVDSLPKVKFVQIGAKEHIHPELTGDNVINFIGKTQDRKTGIRDLFRLFYFAEGSMGLVSFQMHLAAAFGMPCIVIAGAREPARFTRYPNHQYLCTDGCLPCASTTACWHCDLEKTCQDVVTDETGKKIPRCVDIIHTKDVLRAFYQFYEGGRLSFDKPRIPTIFTPIVKDSKKESKIFAIPQNKKMPKTPIEVKEFLVPEDFGFSWGGACITEPDWIFLKSVIDKYKVEKVLEFGTGLSTILVAAYGKNIVSYETSDGWIKSFKDKKLNEFIDLRKWDGFVLHDKLDKFDLAIVDGPPGGKSREFSTKIASEHADIVLIHDAGREWERKWQDKYLKETFIGPGKGGSRWHLWVKNHIAEKEKEDKEKKQIEFMKTNPRVFRMLFNGRGDGGAEHSTTWIMNTFVKMGWRVEYVHSTDHPSATFRREGDPKIFTTSDLHQLLKPCDLLLLYANDWVWDFNKIQISAALEFCAAKRKVFVVNFRLGDIGRIPWTRNWDKYLFLNSSLAKDFEDKYSEVESLSSVLKPEIKVLPPPTDLSEFYKKEVDYSGSMRIVRHSSQGDAKYAKDFNEKVKAILDTFPEATIRLMPAPTFLEDFGERVIPHKRNNPLVKEFLSLGNVFWYDLPEGYHDMGPKVVMEAQAVGLPVIANNHSGPRDRIIENSGFLYDDFEDSLKMFKNLSLEENRRMMGEIAKKHALKEYSPNNWISEILGNKSGGKK